MVFAQSDLPTPKLLSCWSTIGFDTASITWRCQSAAAGVKQFRVYYKPSSPPGRCKPVSAVGLSHEDFLKADYQCVRVNKFLPKRSYVVLRNLTPETTYDFFMFSANGLARSAPMMAFFRTMAAPSGHRDNGGWISSREPSPWNYAGTILRAFTRKFIFTQWLFLLFFLIAFILFVVVDRCDLYSVVKSQTCQYLWTFISDYVCPRASVVPPPDREPPSSKDDRRFLDEYLPDWFSWF